MRGVNTNLFEINQAKKRINEAKAKGETPKQADLDLVATEVQKAFAVAQYSEVMNIEKFAKHISTHGCVYSRADISGNILAAEHIDVPDESPLSTTRADVFPDFRVVGFQPVSIL